MAKQSIVDFILEEDYARYNELIEKAAEAKKNAPRKKVERKPMTNEQKAKMTAGRLAKAQAALEALLAAQQNG